MPRDLYPALLFGPLHLVLLLAVPLAIGCGGRTLYGNQDAGANNSNNQNQNQNQNQNSNTNTNQNNNNVTGECSRASDCVVAYKADDCCSCPLSASLEDLAADPCLVPEGAEWPDGCFPHECPPSLCPYCSDLGRTPDCQGGQCVFKEGHCTLDDQCVLAIRTDNCCEHAFAATVSDIEADLCLSYWSGYWNDVPQECLDRWDPECDYIDCMPAPPPSRATECNGSSCFFVSECASDDDCTRLLNWRECCPCPEAWPLSMVGRDPCLTLPTASPPEGCQPLHCDAVLCEPCSISPALRCDPDYGCHDLWVGQDP
jgi:hypothetical protein